MKHNLSSQIVLHRIPRKYYRPDNALELSGISRFEKIKVNISGTPAEGGETIAREIAALIRRKAKRRETCVLGLNSGRSPIEVYEALVRMHREEGLSFANVVVFNLFEYYPLDSSAAQSCLNQIRRMFFDLVDIPAGNIFSPDGSLPQGEIVQHCAEYEQRIEESAARRIEVKCHDGLIHHSQALLYQTGRAGHRLIAAERRYDQ